MSNCWNISMHSFGILKKLSVANKKMLCPNPTLTAALLSCWEHSVAALKFLILSLKPRENLVGAKTCCCKAVHGHEGAQGV